MANACSVFGCGEANRDTSLHLFPKDHTMLEKWLHFEDSCFLNLGVFKLIAFILFVYTSSLLELPQ
uniref:THAP-type domain-containing protein n=1 Tax=Echeneis naucrates TaxID=173247 RepID=A0A665UT46_ECHNA